MSFHDLRRIRAKHLSCSHAAAPDELLAAWSFSWVFRRDEVIAALEHHAEQISGARQRTEGAIRDVNHSAATPTHVAEHWRITQARLDGQAAWARDAATLIRAGEYWFDGEPNPPWPPHQDSASAPV